jgi:hypothetical protein
MPLVSLFVAGEGTLPVDAPGPGVADGVLHGFDVSRHLPKLSWLPWELFLDSLESEGYQRLVAVADAGNLGPRKVFPEAKQKDLDGGRFSQPFVGVESSEQLEDLRGDAALCLIRLRGLSG